MSTGTAIFNAEAEESALGCWLLSATAVEIATGSLIPEDFGRPKHQSIFSAIGVLRAQGAAIDSATVLDQLRMDGKVWEGAGADLLQYVSNTPSLNGIHRYCEIVARFALRRRLRAEGLELSDAAEDITKDPGELLDAHQARLAEIDSPVLTRHPGDASFEDFASVVVPASAVVVPGLLTEDDRGIFVAPEGYGKSEVLRQFTTAVPAGLHPLMPTRRIEPAPSLLVDLENPAALLRRRLRELSDTAEMLGGAEQAPRRVWHRPGGIDLRRRADRLAFEDVLRRGRPKLVAIGPVYKLYSKRANESDEQVTSEVQVILDDLRTRFGFALLLEHHAPQPTNGHRDIRPFGSSLWLRWPEFGLKLTPHKDRPGALVVGRWRGDRVQAEWPDELHRSSPWPWSGWWKDGLPSPHKSPIAEREE
ncbi:MAG: hypothetical protein JWM85_2331 [Acidimicrobiaceae bacterium]|nr:hypothetical protein [Acidimicrobiaceae bacterium]